MHLARWRVCPGERQANVPSLLAEARTRPDASLSVAIIDVVETILAYNLATSRREEIAAMFGSSDQKQTRVYQEARQGGIQVGRREGEARLLLRLITRRFGQIDLAMLEQIEALDLPQLEVPGEALLDFAAPRDLQAWRRDRTAMEP